MGRGRIGRGRRGELVYLRGGMAGVIHSEEAPQGPSFPSASGVGEGRRNSLLLEVEEPNEKAGGHGVEGKGGPFWLEGRKPLV